MEPPKSLPAGIAKLSHPAGWTLREYAQVDSTNFVAAPLPAWSAVRADTQTAGRGRFQRPWVSDAGGLWLSAVVPTPGEREAWQTLPLAAGLAVLEALKDFGVKTARLRWPNDIMVEDRKLAGLLLDTFEPGLAVIGLGVNVTNQPALQDPALRQTATRLADVVLPVPGLADLAAAILAQLRAVVEVMTDHGFAALQPRVNARWGRTRRVYVELDLGTREGVFTGVDPAGRLHLLGDGGSVTVLAPHQVRLLREL